jgi:hypothetical protein
VSDNLTPTAQAILDSLREHPATAADLRDQTGRSRSTIDKALTDLTKAGLIAKAAADGEDSDGPTQWVLTPTDAAPDALAGAPSPKPDDGATAPDEPPTDVDSYEDDSGGTASPADTEEPDSADPPPGQQVHGADAEDADVTATPEAEVKVCRGCGEQMPKTCPTCWSKTTAYCGTCRRTQPTARRRAPGEPQILANGLPKLRPGELEHLVLDVLRTQPLPDHLGITGWTPGRVAIFLPGRSTGAISNALDKLAATGQAQLLADNPKRYQPTPDPAPPHDGEQDDPGDIDQQQ